MQSMALVAQPRQNDCRQPRPEEESCQQRPGDDAYECVSACSTDVGHKDSECCSNAALEVETLIIFDYDDTLFPTSWLRDQGLFDDAAVLNSEQELHLQKLADSVASTLQIALQLGKVVVVTNAEQFWIEVSCTKFMPSLAALLQTVDIVSAQTTFKQVAEDPCEWKRLAFEEEINLVYGPTGPSADQLLNIMSVGDSFHELHALKSVTKDMANCCSKSIKLLGHPSIEDLIDQHGVLTSRLVDVAEHNGNLDEEIRA